LIAIALPTLVLLAIAGAFFIPTGKVPAPPEGWKALRDDALAAKFAPPISCPERFGAIERVLYRAARGPDGSIRIAYHYVWDHEENPAGTFGAFLSRMLYTGGLSLQRLMFGPGDVEAIGVELSPSLEPVSISYEEAEGYDEAAMTVRHRKVIDAPWPESGASFEVASWNHLFSLSEGIVSEAPAPEYFDAGEWARYGMTKAPPTFVFRHRAHFDWELAP
jgi:hypothetical protein